MEKQKNDISITNRFRINDTLLCKGIAVFIMLFHHLFFREQSWELYFWKLELLGKPIIARLAEQGKVCVALFVFLSAYGLTMSFKKKVYINKDYSCNLKKELFFVGRKIKDLYFLYCPVFIITVCVSVIVGNPNIRDVYSSIGEGIRDFLGIAYIFDSRSAFCGAWWYISLALVLYIILPVCYRIVKYFTITILIIALLLSIRPMSNTAILLELERYLFTYLLGIYFAEKDLLNYILSRKSSFVLLGSAICCVVFLVVRSILNFEVDGFFSLSIIIFIYKLFQFRALSSIKKCIVYFGKHSDNIFLIHGMIYKFWLPKFVYGFYYPVLIWVVLLVLSLISSIMIKFLINFCGKIKSCRKVTSEKGGLT